MLRYRTGTSFVICNRDKDVEIEEYVNSGVKLTRPSLKTQWFRREDFEQQPLTASHPLRLSSIRILGSEECNRLLEKVSAAAAVMPADGPAKEAATQTKVDMTDSSASAAATQKPTLTIPQPTQKRKVEKPVVKVSKKTTGQKKLMKL